MHILWHYLFDIFRVVIQYWRGFQPPMILTTVQKKSDKNCRNGQRLEMQPSISLKEGLFSLRPADMFFPQRCHIFFQLMDLPVQLFYMKRFLHQLG
jgi:hypothetical protein